LFQGAVAGKPQSGIYKTIDPSSPAFLTNAMNVLTLIRHAKSSWKDPALTDRERPLNKRGRRDAPEIASRLHSIGQTPSIILSSPALRALITAKNVAQDMGRDFDQILVLEEIYFQGVAGLMSAVGRVVKGNSNVCLVGHNPDLTDFANLLGDMDIDNIPTAGIVVIEFTPPITALSSETRGHTIRFNRPKDKE
jgi:phosphohistidine phosphatase